MGIVACCHERKSKWSSASVCIRTLEAMSGATCGADEINDKLVDHFLRTPPTDLDMRALATLHQQFSQTNGIEDFACTTIYLCAQQAIMERARVSLTDSQGILRVRVATVRSISSFSELAQAQFVCASATGALDPMGTH